MDTEFRIEFRPRCWIVLKPLPDQFHALHIGPGEAGNDETQVGRLDLIYNRADLFHIDVCQSVGLSQKFQGKAVVAVDDDPRLIAGDGLCQSPHHLRRGVAAGHQLLLDG